MVKLLSLVRRRTDISPDEFAEIWLRDYAPVAARLPKLRRYVVNVVTPASEQHEYDGFAELWFDSEDDARAAFAEPELAEALETGRHAFIADHAIYAVAETTVAG